MSRLIQFAKLQAAGNDFIVLDTEHCASETLTPELIQRLCKRHYGVGADGLIYLNGLGMRYYNADGSVGAMCGNGLRAAVLYAYTNGKLGRDQDFEMQADDGIHTVRYEGQDSITVEILNSKPLARAVQLDLPGEFHFKGFFNTGVPHIVLECSQDLGQVDVAKMGRALRYDPQFEPQGTNVNFCRPAAGGVIHLRTYERGVEAETQACGTGAVATALAYGLYQGQRLIRTHGGMLRIEQKGEQLFLNGSARMVFVGQVLLDGHRP